MGGAFLFKTAIVMSSAKRQKLSSVEFRDANASEANEEKKVEESRASANSTNVAPKLSESTTLTSKETAAYQQLVARAEAEQKVESYSYSDFKASRVPPFLFSPAFGFAECLISLDLSRNELKDLPPQIGTLSLLTHLNVSRNLLKRLPPELRQLLHLGSIDASSNQLSPTTLDFPSLASLPRLRSLDLRYNNRFFNQEHTQLLAAQLSTVKCQTTPRAPFEQVPHAADRDATQLYAQLAPFSTGTLRRRLALAFGEVTDPDKVERAHVVDKLLQHYKKPGNERRVRRVQGEPVPGLICAALLKALQRWAELGIRERPTIHAEQYMIITTPLAFSKPNGRKALNAAKKMATHATLWGLAKAAIEAVDKEFAAKITAVAFTRNFQGSAHIDTQNTGPFYGMALGDFTEGTGALCVECSAREVAHVDTRNRMGRVDGRFPHWVAPFTGTRFSVIFYTTNGATKGAKTNAPRTTAVFKGTPMVQGDPATFPASGEDRYYNRYCRETNTYQPSS